MDFVKVSLNTRSYRIAIENNILTNAGKFISKMPVQKKATVITNTKVASLYLPTLVQSLIKESFIVHQIVIPDGEKYKNLTQIKKIFDYLFTLNLDRNSPIIALGGGVVGDIAGFAASTFMRGIPCIQIPTTLLAQVDSSVGGKTGVNMPGGKNLIGTFYQPALVIIDPHVLGTLNLREIKTGMAEVIKYAIIHNKDFYDFLFAHLKNALELETDTISHIIKICCTIKAAITAEDETEKGIRSILNFGHTLGHAIETLTNYRKYTHGEAVAIGMSAAAKLSYEWKYCPEEECKKVESLIKLSGLPTALPAFSSSEYMNIIMKDKKKSGEKIKLVLMKKIGKVCIEDIPYGKLLKTLRCKFYIK